MRSAFRVVIVAWLSPPLEGERNFEEKGQAETWPLVGGYRRRERTDCGAEFAWASIEIPLCCRICNLV